jgi:hypothetical protein
MVDNSASSGPRLANGSVPRFSIYGPTMNAVLIEANSELESALSHCMSRQAGPGMMQSESQAFQVHPSSNPERRLTIRTRLVRRHYGIMESRLRVLSQALPILGD